MLLVWYVRLHNIDQTIYAAGSNLKIIDFKRIINVGENVAHYSLVVLARRVSDHSDITSSPLPSVTNIYYITAWFSYYC